MTFDRPAFEAAVAKRSPLSPRQFDALLGGSVDGGNKALAWRVMCLPWQAQTEIWQAVAGVRAVFPAAILTGVFDGRQHPERPS